MFFPLRVLVWRVRTLNGKFHIFFLKPPLIKELLFLRNMWYSPKIQLRIKKKHFSCLTFVFLQKVLGSILRLVETPLTFWNWENGYISISQPLSNNWKKLKALCFVFQFWLKEHFLNLRMAPWCHGWQKMRKALFQPLKLELFLTFKVTKQSSLSFVFMT